MKSTMIKYSPINTHVKVNTITLWELLNCVSKTLIRSGCQ